jgi:hypothetical protein
MVGDTTSPQQFTDDNLQDALDAWQSVVRQSTLTPVLDLSGIGYVDFNTNGQGHWEDGYVLTNDAGTTLVPTYANLITGYFTVASPQSALYITGQYYEIEGASGRCLQYAGVRSFLFL